jgi:hypothetical protein
MTSENKSWGDDESEITMHTAVKSEGNVATPVASVPRTTQSNDQMAALQAQMAQMMLMMQSLQEQNAALKQGASTPATSSHRLFKTEEVKGIPCPANDSLHGCDIIACDKDHTLCTSKGKCDRRSCQWRHLVQDPCPAVEQGLSCPRLMKCRHIHTAGELGLEKKPRRAPSPDARGRRQASPDARGRRQPSPDAQGRRRASPDARGRSQASSGSSRRKASREAGQRCSSQQSQP